MKFILQKNEEGLLHNIQMYNNFFFDNWGAAAYGILLKEITDSYITCNHFTKNTTAI